PRVRRPARPDDLHHHRAQLYQPVRGTVRDPAINRYSLLRRSTNMPKQRYYEDVEVGSEVGPLEKNPTTQQLVKYAGASGDFYQIHYDKDFAINAKLPGVILHGALKNAFLGQLMTDFAGERGWLKKLAVQYRGMDQPGTKVVCRGRVTRKYVEG